MTKLFDPKITSSYAFITHDPREKLITKAEFDVAC